MSYQPQLEPQLINPNPNLDCFINNEPLTLSIKCNHLSNFLNKTFNEEESSNTDKKKLLYKSLPLILQNLYASPIDNEEDFWALHDLFTPNSMHYDNLFTVIINPHYHSALNYILDLSTISSYFPQSNSILRTNVKVLKEIMGDVLVMNDSTKKLYDNNKCLIPLFEYFILIFLISAKNVGYTSRKYLNVIKEEDNGNGNDNIKRFSDYFTWSNSGNSTPDQETKANTPYTSPNGIDVDINSNTDTKANDHKKKRTLNTNRSFQYNFFIDILEEYLYFFYDTGMKTKLSFIFKAIEISWLYDYYSIKHKYNSTSIIFEKGKETKFSQLFNAIQSHSNPNTNTSQAPSISSSSSAIQPLNVKYPNLLLIDCLSSFITFTYRQLQVEIIFPMKQPLLSFIEFIFEAKSTYYLTDVYMSDIITLWLNYISPWNIINKHHTTINQSKQFIAQFITMNIPFYISILDKCIIAFSLYKTNQYDYVQLANALLLFSVKKNDPCLGKGIVFDYVPFELLRSYALGNMKAFAGCDGIEKALEYYDRNDINGRSLMTPYVSDSQGRLAASKMIINNKTLIKQLTKDKDKDVDKENDHKDIKTLPESKAFVDMLNDMNDTIKILYQIDDSTTMSLLIKKDNLVWSSSNDKQLYLNRVILPDKDPWTASKQEDEILLLYYLFKAISKGIDKIRGVNDKESKDENTKDKSLTNLRPLCNTYALLNSLTLIVVICILIYIIKSTSHTIILKNK